MLLAIGCLIRRLRPLSYTKCAEIVNDLCATQHRVCDPCATTNFKGESMMINYTAMITPTGSFRLMRYGSIAAISIARVAVSHDVRGRTILAWKAFPLGAGSKPSRKGWATPQLAAARFGKSAVAAIDGAQAAALAKDNAAEDQITIKVGDTMPWPHRVSS